MVPNKFAFTHVLMAYNDSLQLTPEASEAPLEAVNWKEWLGINLFMLLTRIMLPQCQIMV